MISVIFAPLLYLAPVGVGLLLLWPLREQPWGVRLTIAFLVGVVFITRLYELAEEKSVIEHLFFSSIFLVGLTSALGVGLALARSRRAKVRWSVVALGAAMTIPSFLFCYFWISRFPFTDVFQDIHPMKTAEEFARVHVLNGGGISYIPVKPVLNGLMISTFGYDQLVGVWALAPWTAFFRLLVAWRATTLVAEGGNRIVAFVLLAGMLLAFDMTNGVMCVFGAILLLVELVEFGKGFDRKPLGAAVVFLLPISVYLEWRFMGPEPVPSLAVMALILVAMWALWRTRPQFGRALLIVLLTGSLVQLHRGSMLFVAVASIAAAAYTMQHHPVVLRLAGIAGRVLLPVGLGASALVIAASVARVSLPLSFDQFYVSILTALVRVDGPETMLGTGAKNAAIEWMQAVGPFVAAMIGSVIVWSTVTWQGRKLWLEPGFVIPYGLASGLTCAILTGLPYVYRSTPLACVLFAVSLSVALPRLWTYLREPRSLPALALLGLGGGYGLLMLAVPSLSLYAKFYWPVLACLIVAAALVACCMWAAPRYRAAVLLGALATALVADRLSEKVALFPHVYGVPQAPVSYVSHYGEAELAAADAIAELPPETLIVSDPHTVSIIRARSGLNTIFAYSNLDTLNGASESRLREALSAVRAGDREGFCAELRRMLPAAGEYINLLDRLHINKTALAVVVAYSSRTTSWTDLTLGARASYFPSLKALDDAVVQNLSSAADKAHLVRDRILVMNLKCEVPRPLTVQSAASGQ